MKTQEQAEREEMRAIRRTLETEAIEKVRNNIRIQMNSYPKLKVLRKKWEDGSTETRALLLDAVGDIQEGLNYPHAGEGVLPSAPNKI